MIFGKIFIIQPQADDYNNSQNSHKQVSRLYYEKSMWMRIACIYSIIRTIFSRNCFFAKNIISSRENT